MAIRTKRALEYLALVVMAIVIYAAYFIVSSQIRIETKVSENSKAIDRIITTLDSDYEITE